MADFTEIEKAANDGAFGLNNQRTPSHAQTLAGNYKVGRTVINGLSVSIEQPRHSYRSGHGWRTKLSAHYGYFTGTRGADGDPVDCFIGYYPQSEHAYVINQFVNGTFDEHKVMLACESEPVARKTYLDSYEKGWNGLHSIVKVSISQLKWWLKNGNLSKPLKPDHLPYEGPNMNYDKMLYELRHDDAGQGLIYDAICAADIIEHVDSLLSFDALVTPYSKLQQKMDILMGVFERNGGEIKPVSMQLTDPYKQNGVTQVAAIFEMSDGQTVSIFFHNPDVKPNSIAPSDTLVSWRWMLNKRDVTIAVAPERGKDLDVKIVAARIIKLAEKNSAAFKKANVNRADRLQAIETIKTEIVELEVELKTVQHELELAQQAQEDRIMVPLPQNLPDNPDDVVDPVKAGADDIPDDTYANRDERDSAYNQDELDAFRDKHDEVTNGLEIGDWTEQGYTLSDEFTITALHLEKTVSALSGGDLSWGDYNASAYINSLLDDSTGHIGVAPLVIFDSATLQHGDICAQIGKEGAVLARGRIEENGVLTLYRGANGLDQIGSPTAVLSKIDMMLMSLFGVTEFSIPDVPLDPELTLSMLLNAVDAAYRAGADVIQKGINSVDMKDVVSIESGKAVIAKLKEMVGDGGAQGITDAINAWEVKAGKGIESIPTDGYVNGYNLRNDAKINLNQLVRKIEEVAAKADQKVAKFELKNLPSDAPLLERAKLIFRSNGMDPDGGKGFQRLIDAIESKNVDYLVSLLSVKTNVSSRAVFELYSGVTLGSAVTKQIENWAGITDEDRAAKQAEIDAEKERVAEQARVAAENERAARLAEIDGFGADLAPLQLGKVIAALNKPLRLDSGAPDSLKNHVKSLIEQGKLPKVVVENRIKDMSRRAYNNATNEEQAAHERRVAAGGTVEKYYIGGYELGKIAYDYATHLINNDAGSNQDYLNHVNLLQGIVDGASDSDDLTELLDKIDAAATALIDAGKGDEYDALIGQAAEKWAALDQERNG